MKAPSRSRPAEGALIVLGGVLLVSPDGTILTAMRAGTPTILFARGLLMSLAFVAILRVRAGRVLDRQLWSIGRSGVGFVVLGAIGNILFVTSLRNTSIAHTLLLAATVPAITAAITRLSNAEPIPRKTILAAGGVLFGVAGLVISDPGKTALVGDLEALGAAFALACGLLLAPRDERLPAAQACVAMLVCILALAWAHPSRLHTHDVVLAVLGFGLLIPCASSIVFGGRRHLTATEISLLMMSESIFGPFWGWLGIGQRPSWQTIAAGCVILVSVAGHTLVGV